MSARSKLRSALSSIDNSISALKRAKNNNPTPDVENQIRKAIRELEEAQEQVKRAMNQIDD